ncbi:MOSC domain-containing protein [Algoriphagus hitonicola]|uniref:MOSC domain-containing protein n=1 Tax=Algoriphagus hitonicola TaxID=435880 RepID=A0A1I2VHG5_9BACT|nr:MOSC N-terminal beta barrel domain-containing protein [Algoriphagus hitonicola]SFG86631.1 hypothetical protein SAMN04487988_109117 [Algoriphagus hitonicola]
MSEKLEVQDIFIYPIKSLGGIRVESAEVRERGFRYDRRWMLVTPDRMFVSQRKIHKMALLQVEIKADGLSVFQKNDPKSQIFIPFDECTEESILVTVWDDQMEAKKVGSDYDRWFSDSLGFDVILVKMTEQSHRPVSPKYAVNGETVSFADGMPYLVIGQSSLDDLNSRLDIPVKMDRFRPNIVFSGGTPYLEDSMRKLKIGNLNFQVVKPCARCVMTTVDQQTAELGKEPLRTLATYRTNNNKVLFGQNAVALEAGEIKVGDKIQLIG